MSKRTFNYDWKLPSKKKHAFMLSQVHNKWNIQYKDVAVYHTHNLIALYHTHNLIIALYHTHNCNLIKLIQV